MGFERGASAIGKGLLAGVVGTAAMTVSSTVESKLRDRGSSTAPADAAGKVLGVEPHDDAGEQRFSNLVHWAYGTGWGAVRGLIGAVGLAGPVATATHLATVWGTEQVVLPTLDVSPPGWEWGGREIAIDGFHHLVYATAAGVVYEALTRGDED